MAPRGHCRLCSRSRGSRRKHEVRLNAWSCSLVVFYLCGMAGLRYVAVSRSGAKEKPSQRTLVWHSKVGRCRRLLHSVLIQCVVTCRAGFAGSIAGGLFPAVSVDRKAGCTLVLGGDGLKVRAQLLLMTNENAFRCVPKATNASSSFKPGFRGFARHSSR